MHHRGIVRRRAGELRVQRRQRRCTAGVDEQPADALEKIVAGRPVHRPALAQALARFENLLDDDPRVGSRAAQAMKVRLGVAEPIRVVDADPGERPVLEPADDAGVGVGEDRCIFAANTGD